jgi:hypothetical protein
MQCFEFLLNGRNFKPFVANKGGTFYRFSLKLCFSFFIIIGFRANQRLLIYSICTIFLKIKRERFLRRKKTKHEIIEKTKIVIFKRKKGRNKTSTRHF